jgi:hypothetical protein
MNPVRGYTMLSFLNWMIREHPETKTIRDTPRKLLMRLVDEFEHGKLQGNEALARKWEVGFDFLLNSNGDWQGYDEARRVVDTLGRGRYSRYQEKTSDPLGRYRSIPLHGVFMYSTEDSEFSEYTSSNWDALDRMSNDFCDLHPSIDQLGGLEDVYDIVNSHSNLLHGISDIRLRDLPGIMFWDNRGDNEYISFSGRDRPGEIRSALRTIFDYIRNDPTIQSVAAARMDLKMNTP